LLQNRFQGSV